MQHTSSTPEVWKPVLGYERHYEVSDCGNVRSVDRIVTNRLGVSRNLKGRDMKIHEYIPSLKVRPARPGGEPLYVRLSLDGKSRIRYVHTLVLEAFVGPRPEGMECCHNNGDCHDNRLENLRWDTPKANGEDMVKHGTNFHTNKTHCGRGHKLSHPNLVPSLWEKDRYRDCLACSRARAHVNYHTHLKPHMKDISDQYYEKILREESKAS